MLKNKENDYFQGTPTRNSIEACPESVLGSASRELVMKPDLLIAVPVLGGNIKIQCAVSLVALCSTFALNGIQFEIRHRSSADIVQNRNFLASAALARPSTTHLLFVDSDMEFRPQAVSRMIKLSKTDHRMHLSDATGYRCDFVVDVGGETRLQVLNGACKVSGVGMGLYLIQRTVLEGMVASGQLRRSGTPRKRNESSHGPVYGYFDPLISKDQYFSEDLSFCRRWTSLCDGEVWALVDEEIGHIGETTYKARFLDYVRSSRQ